MKRALDELSVRVRSSYAPVAPHFLTITTANKL